MKSVNILAGLAVLALCGAATAQPGGVRRDRNADISRQQAAERTAQRFDRLDLDRDGRLTADEAQQARAHVREQRADRAFDRLDLDRNGNVTRAEFNQAHDQLRGRLAERREGMAGPSGQPRVRAMRRAHGVQAMRAGRMLQQQGFISREQFEGRAMARFDRLDHDGNGIVTVAERRQAAQLRREARRGRQQQD